MSTQNKKTPTGNKQIKNCQAIQTKITGHKKLKIKKTCDGGEKRKWKIFDSKSQRLIGGESKIGRHNKSHEKVFPFYILIKPARIMHPLH